MENMEAAMAASASLEQSLTNNDAKEYGQEAHMSSEQNLQSGDTYQPWLQRKGETRYLNQLPYGQSPQGMPMPGRAREPFNEFEAPMLPMNGGNVKKNMAPHSGFSINNILHRNKEQKFFDEELGYDVQGALGNDSVAFDDIARTGDKGPYGVQQPIDTTPFIPTLGLPPEALRKGERAPTNNIEYRKQMNYQKKAAISNSVAPGPHPGANFNPGAMPGTRTMSLASNRYVPSYARTMSLGKPAFHFPLPEDGNMAYPRAMSLNNNAGPMRASNTNQGVPYGVGHQRVAPPVFPPASNYARSMSLNSKGPYSNPPFNPNGAPPPLNVMPNQRSMSLRPGIPNPGNGPLPGPSYGRPPPPGAVPNPGNMRGQQLRQPIYGPIGNKRQQGQSPHSNAMTSNDNYTTAGALSVGMTRGPQPSGVNKEERKWDSSSEKASGMGMPKEERISGQKGEHLYQPEGGSRNLSLKDTSHSSGSTNEGSRNEPDAREEEEQRKKIAKDDLVSNFKDNELEATKLTRELSIKKSNSMRLRKIDFSNNKLDTKEGVQNLPTKGGDSVANLNVPSFNLKKSDYKRESILRSDVESDNDSPQKRNARNLSLLGANASSDSPTKDVNDVFVTASDLLTPTKKDKTNEVLKTQKYEDENFQGSSPSKERISPSKISDRPKIKSLVTNTAYDKLRFFPKGEATTAPAGQRAEENVYSSEEEEPDSTLVGIDGNDHPNSEPVSEVSSNKQVESSSSQSPPAKNATGHARRKPPVDVIERPRSASSNKNESFILTKQDLELLNCNQDLMDELETITSELAASIRRELNFEAQLRNRNLPSLSEHNDVKDQFLEKLKVLVDLQEKLNKERSMKFIYEDYILNLKNGNEPSALQLNLEKEELRQQLLEKERAHQSDYNAEEHRTGESIQKDPNFGEKYEELMKENDHLKLEIIPNLEKRLSSLNLKDGDSVKPKELNLVKSERQNLSNQENEFNVSIEMDHLRSQRDELREVVSQLKSNHSHEVKILQEKIVNLETKLDEATQLNRQLTKRLDTPSPTKNDEHVRDDMTPRQGRMGISLLYGDKSLPDQ